MFLRDYILDTEIPRKFPIVVEQHSFKEPWCVGFEGIGDDYNRLIMTIIETLPPPGVLS